MTESSPPFEKETFSSDAAEAFRHGNLLNWLSENLLNTIDEHRQEISATLVELHNSGTIDLIHTINSGGLTNLLKHDFWELQTLYCQLIPILETHAEPLMEAVACLVDSGRNDLAANLPNRAFREWLAYRPAETKRLLRKAQQSSTPTITLLAFVLEAGADQNLPEYHAASISFLNDDNPENRQAGIIALGRIDTSKHQEIHLKSLTSLSNHACMVTSNSEMAEAVGALLDVYARCPGVEEDRVIKTIRSASARPTAVLHFLLARSLGVNYRKFSNDLQITIIDALASADPSNKGVVDQIDFALAHCIDDNNREAIAATLQALLSHPESALDLVKMKNLIHNLHTKHRRLLSWLTIYWLRFGNHHARLSLPSLFRQFSTRDTPVAFDLEHFEFQDRELVFISRKALGYLPFEATIATSILISCLRKTSDNSAAKIISHLLFDPLMINFPGQARDVVQSHAKANDKRKRHLRDALKAHDAYLAGLRSLMDVPELWPSPSERRVQAERQRQLFSQSMKKAQQQSVLLPLFTKQTLLHGIGAVHRMHTPDGPLRRSESLLSSHTTSMEFPRLVTIDPVHFQHLILQLRQEDLDP